MYTLHKAQLGVFFSSFYFFLFIFFFEATIWRHLFSLLWWCTQHRIFQVHQGGSRLWPWQKDFFFHSFWKHEHDDGSRTAWVTGSKIVGEIDMVFLKPLIFIPHPHIRPQSYHLIKAQWHTRFHREWLLESSDVASCCSCCDHDRRDIKLEAHEHGCVDARTERVRSVAECLPMIGLDLRAYQSPKKEYVKPLCWLIQEVWLESWWSYDGHIKWGFKDRNGVEVNPIPITIWYEEELYDSQSGKKIPD